MANNSSNTVGLMVSSFRGGFFGDLMAEVQEVVDSAGKLMIVTQGRHSAESERKAIEHLIKMRCDGLILHARYLSDEEIIAIAEKAPPLVLIDRNIRKLANNCITFDHVKASEKAMGQLIGNGHRKIACMAGKLTKSKAYERFQGYVNSLERHHLPVDMNLVTEGAYERESGYSAAMELLAKARPFTAIYACSEELAAGCMDAFRERNIRVPEDISLASYDSVDLCTFLTPHVTALHFPITDMARTAGCLLMHRIHPDRFDAPENTVFEGELRIRESIKKLV
ncbi:substrate-binding domain-containing protein [Endozoicomonas sp. Mp262]|uniref:substrate-binding domain-containing protein n=1 Tax=Endozoicomonas sp. Mp262 TaxID=2919499 RepID=UPI0021E00126